MKNPKLFVGVVACALLGCGTTAVPRGSGALAVDSILAETLADTPRGKDRTAIEGRLNRAGRRAVIEGLARHTIGPAGEQAAAWLNAARAWLPVHGWERAIAAARKAESLARQETDAAARVQLMGNVALVYAAAGSHGEVDRLSAELTPVLEAVPPGARGQLASAMAARGKPDEGLALLGELSAMDQKNMPVLMASLSAVDDADEARRRLAKALPDERLRLGAELQMATMILAFGATESAVDLMLSLPRGNDRLPRLWVGITADFGQLDQAQRIAEAMASGIERANTLLLLAKQAAAQGEVGLAEEAFETALADLGKQLEQPSLWLIERILEVELMLGDAEAAKARCQGVIAKPPRSRDERWQQLAHCGALLHALGDPAGAALVEAQFDAVNAFEDKNRIQARQAKMIVRVARHMAEVGGAKKANLLIQRLHKRPAPKDWLAEFVEACVRGGHPDIALDWALNEDGHLGTAGLAAAGALEDALLSAARWSQPNDRALALATIAIELPHATVMTPKAEAAAATLRRPGPPSKPQLGTGGVRWVHLASRPHVAKQKHPRYRDPRNVVKRPDAFDVLQTEVTAAQFTACVEAGACGKVPPLEHERAAQLCTLQREDAASHPVNCVDHAAATAFCAWVGGRLPSYDEWYYGARSGGLPGDWPWGHEAPSCERALYAEGGAKDRSDQYTQSGCGTGSTQPVCSRPTGRSAQGVCDLYGNVGEWLSKRYEGRNARVAGGSLFSRALDPRATAALKDALRDPGIGFRCVRPKAHPAP